MIRTEGGWGRKLFHFLAGSFFPILALFLSREILLFLVALAMAMVLAGEVLRLRRPGVNRWVLRYLRPALKEVEYYQVTGATFLLLATFILFAFFPWGLAQAALLFLAWGDPAAALAGERWGNVWLRGKSLEGGLAFFLAALLAGAVVSGVGGVTPLLVVGGAFLAALLEFVPIVDDNLSTPLLSAGGMWAISCIGGWPAGGSL